MTEIEKSVNIINRIILSEGTRKGTYCYREILAQARNPEIPAAISEYLKLVGEVASYNFMPSNTWEPFGPLFKSSDGRSAIPSDLRVNDINKLRELAPNIENFEIKARIYDVFWLNERKPDDLRCATYYYIDAANDAYNLKHWSFAIDYIERALRLASLTKRKDPKLFNFVEKILLKWLTNHSDLDQIFLTGKSISLLLQFRYENVQELYKKAVHIAEVAQQVNNHHQANEYWLLAVEAAKLAKNEDDVNWAQTQLAEFYVSCARVKALFGLIAAHWMQKAIESYKVVPDSKARREELYKELLNFQKSSLIQMKNFENSIDVTDIINASIKTMEGLSATDALFTLAFRLNNPPNYEKLRAQALELAQKYPLSSLFGEVYLDHEGKVVAKFENGFESNDSVSDREVFRLAALEHQLIAECQIVPAIDVLMTQHAISEQDMLMLVLHNPFVENGQELLYAQALWAGFKKDFVTAIFLLIPLLENSLRYVLKNAGECVSTITSSGVQESLRIGAIIDHKKTLEIFGEDTIQDLKGILISRTYANLRNKVSHGIVSWETFNNPYCVYLWWLILRLILNPYYLSK